MNFEWSLGARQPTSPPTADPMVGWRLWRVRDEALLSWGVQHQWRPGTNEAACLGQRHCAKAPGKECGCGFWALYSPRKCLRYARTTVTERSCVLGLVRAWGEIAVHGREGFRGQYATVVCLFTDWVWDLDELPDGAPRPPSLWRRIRRRLSTSVAPAETRQPQLRRLADDFAVPLLSLDGAFGSGFLAEVGAGEPACLEIPGRSQDSRGRLPGRAHAGGESEG